MWCYEDKEAEPVRKALDSFPGIACFEWCWGHGNQPFAVRFVVRKASLDLKPILYALNDVGPVDAEAGLECEWALEVEHNALDAPFSYRLRGPRMSLEAIPEKTTRLIERLGTRRRTRL